MSPNTVLDHEVQVKLIHLDSSASELEQSGVDPVAILSQEEFARARGITIPARSRQWMLSRVMLRRTLGAILEVAPQSIEFDCNEFGKPHLSQSLLSKVGPFWFNATHSGEYAAIATSRVGEVGIDLEARRPIKRLAQKAQLFLSDTEQQELFAASESDQELMFLRMWVLKETLAKALGGGLQNRTRSLQVSCQPHPHAICLEESAARWQIEEFCITGYVGAVAWTRG